MKVHMNKNIRLRINILNKSPIYAMLMTFMINIKFIIMKIV